MTWPTEGPKEWNDQELVTAALLNQELQGPLNYLHDEHPPKRAVMWHMNSIVTVGGLISLYVETGQPFNHYAQQQPRANGDEFTQSFYLRAGTYTFKVLGMNGNYNGIIDWYLDGDQQENLIASGQDWYQGGPNAT